MSFDEHALQYDADLQQGLRLSGEAPGWFAGRRVAIARRLLEFDGVTIRHLVEFGCGTGNHVPFFRRAFPGCRITGLDISAESLWVARQTYPGPDLRLCAPSAFRESATADLVYVNGVFHHIPAAGHAGHLCRLREMLRPGGRLLVFDNNPYSLPARMVMKLIPFDRDAVMVNPYRFGRLIEQCGLRLIGREFHFIFPRPLGFLRPLEHRLRRWPIGAQYCLLAARE